MRLLKLLVPLLLLNTGILFSATTHAATVLKPIDVRKNIYLISISNQEIATLEKNKRVDVKIQAVQAIIDGSIVAINIINRQAKLKILDQGIKLVRGQNLKIKVLNPSIILSREYLEMKGAGISMRASAEYHSNSDILYGGVLTVMFNKNLEVDTGVNLGTHIKTNGNQVSITSADGQLRYFIDDFFNFGVGSRYKLYQETFSTKPKPSESASDTTAQAKTPLITDSYTYHDEDAIYISVIIGARFDYRKAALGESFIFAMDAGLDYEVYPISGTIPGYNPLDPDLIGLSPGMTVFGRLSIGYTF